MAAIAAIGLDLAKSWFQVHGAGAQGRPVLRKKLARGKVRAFFASLPPCLVGMEACGSAHPYRPAVAGRFRSADRIVGSANDGPASWPGWATRSG
jgi:transposase